MTTDYFFAPPADGDYLILFSIKVVAAFLVALAAWIISRRTEYAATRKRARSLRSIMLWLAIPGALYLVAREENVGLFELRVWMWLILLVASLRFVRWLLELRSLEADKVDEQQRRRKRGYLNQRRRAKPKPKRRRR